MILGLSISKYFPKGPSNPQGAWYRGTVDNFKTDEGGVTWYHVTYEDGDHEYMTEDSLKITFVGRSVSLDDDDGERLRGKIVASIPADREKYGAEDVDLWRVKYQNGAQEDHELEMILEILDD